jgi:hypothetical protein
LFSKLSYLVLKQFLSLVRGSYEINKHIDLTQKNTNIVMSLSTSNKCQLKLMGKTMHVIKQKNDFVNTIVQRNHNEKDRISSQRTGSNFKLIEQQQQQPNEKYNKL